MALSCDTGVGMSAHLHWDSSLPTFCMLGHFLHCLSGTIIVPFFRDLQITGELTCFGTGEENIYCLHSVKLGTFCVQIFAAMITSQMCKIKNSSL